MNLQQRKLQIIDHVVNSTDKKTIEKIEKVISASSDFWDELSDDQKEAIDKGLKQLDEGKGIPMSKVRKRISKWL